MSKIDRVAQAILTAAMPHANAWDMVTEDDRNRCREQARAAIEAMREPTEGMVYAGEGYSDFVLPTGFRNSREDRQREMRMAYMAMIDAALAESAA